MSSNDTGIQSLLKCSTVILGKMGLPVQIGPHTEHTILY